MILKKVKWLGMALVLAAAPACGDGQGADERPLVVASTSIWADLVRGVAGETVRVEALIPVGADAHEFQPSPAQAALLRRADLVVANGLGLEEGLLDLLASAREEGVEVLEMAPLLDPLPLGDEDGHEGEDPEEGEDHGHEGEDAEEGEDHGHGPLDPHVWLDPVRMARAAEIVAARLEELGIPGGDWEARGAAYRQRLEETHRRVEEILSVIPPERRKLVTNHEALGYFAHRYGFRVVGVIIPGGGTLAEPSARDLAALVEVIEREGVPVIFGETTDPSALAETVAAEADRPVEVVSLYTESLGEPGSGAETYLDMLLTNARLIAEALG